MKYISKIVVSLILIISMLFSTVSCVDLGGTSQSGSQSGGENQKAEFYIKGDNTLYMNVGESLALELVIPEDAKGEVEWTSSHSCVSVQGGVVTANDQGVAVVKAMLGDYVDRVTINVVDSGAPSTPDTPDTPENPDVPDTPDTPDNPSTPDNPNTPETPDNPNNPESPEEEPEEDYRISIRDSAFAQE